VSEEALPPGLEGLTSRLGYRFGNPALLREALTHKSYYFENTSACPSHNERLEFLGDSVLGLAVVERLFRYEPCMTESLMAKVKSYVVKGSVLSRVAVEIGLGEHIMIGKGEEETGGRQKQSILSDALEAVIGAVYMDGGLDAARALVERLVGRRLEEAIDSGELHDYKTQLQETSQTRFGVLPEYRLVAQEGADHNKTFTVEACIGGEPYGRGVGMSKKKAQQEAAKRALARMEQGA
jgi:ribonuclease-3